MKHILDSEIPEMAGLQMPVGSEAACEFMGLAFAGVPLSLALRWCAATQEQDDRPLWTDVQASMTGPDRRNAMRLVQDAGLWFTSSAQLWALDMLGEQDEADVCQAVLAVIERLDAPTPDVVSQEMFGAFEGEAPVNWARLTKSTKSARRGFMSDLCAMPAGSASGSGAKGRWGRARTGGASSGPDGALPGSAEYSANPANWGGKKKAYYRKRRSSSTGSTGSTRTVKAGASYASVKGKTTRRKRTEK
jgi:hypothetical protein